MESQANALAEELVAIKQNLKNPVSVMLNMLHGNIAKLSWDFIERVHGPHPVRAELETVTNKLKQYEHQNHQNHQNH